MMDDKWQESWDRMEEKERRDIGEEPEPCERCEGRGHVTERVTRDMAIDAGNIEMEGQEIASASCTPCRGTGQRLVAGEESGQLCAHCGGAGSFWQKESGGSLSGSRTLCRRCLGTGAKS